MKRTFFLSAFISIFLFFNVSIHAQCTLACYSNINVSLDASGNAILTPGDILTDIPPTCGSLSVSPNSFNCADVGSTITVWVTDAASGNSCFSSILIEDKFSPTLACYANITTALPSDGTLELDPDIFVAFSSDNCPLDFTIVPDVLTCSDIGPSNTVLVTATDPGGNSNTCFSTVNLQYIPPSAMSCISQLYVSLPPSGVQAITPDLILVGPSPPPCALQVSVPTVSCSDIGTPVVVVVSDIISGNSCFSTLIVEDKFAPIVSCNALTNVQLGAGGTIVLDANDILDSYSDNCSLTFSISPSQFDCSDKGKTRAFNITATDPGGNSASCFGNVFIENPRPSSVNINIPSSIPCGATGIGFSVDVVGGNGPFTYEWSIQGNANGWSIVSGQGSPNITMDVGIKKIKLKVKVFDVCGAKRQHKVKISCDNPEYVNLGGIDEVLPSNVFLGNVSKEEINIFPNPVVNQISWNKIDDEFENNEITRYQIIDMNGNVIADGKVSEQRLDVQFLSTGVYILNIKSATKVFSKRFLKMK